jgi:hypothetical protein
MVGWVSGNGWGWQQEQSTEQHFRVHCLLHVVVAHHHHHRYHHHRCLYSSLGMFATLHRSYLEYTCCFAHQYRVLHERFAQHHKYWKIRNSNSLGSK